MNWLRATPSVSETRRASSSNDSCRRQATLLLLISSNLHPRIAWSHHSNPELASGVGEVTHIESDQPIGLTVDRRFQYHLVGGILQSLAPQKPEENRNRYPHQSIENLIHLPQRQATGVAAIRPGEERLPRHDQRDGRTKSQTNI